MIRKFAPCAGAHTTGAIAVTLSGEISKHCENHMNPTKLIGILLVVGGILGLLYGGFSYTKESVGLKLGPIELKVQEKQRVNVPLIVSAGALAVGIFLLAVGRK